MSKLRHVEAGPGRSHGTFGGMEPDDDPILRPRKSGRRRRELSALKKQQTGEEWAATARRRAGARAAYGNNSL